MLTCKRARDIRIVAMCLSRQDASSLGQQIGMRFTILELTCGFNLNSNFDLDPSRSDITLALYVSSHVSSRSGNSSCGAQCV